MPTATRLWTTGAALAVCVCSAVAAAGDPVVGYSTGTRVVVADEAGTEVRSFPAFVHFSFAGSLLAGEREGKQDSTERVVGFDLATGERLFKIPNAVTPVVAAEGGRVAFLPTFRREKFTRSVWMRMSGGRVRKVAQFRGPGVEGIPHGMRGDGVPLDLALDARGRYVAIAFGLETLRSFDVWIVDTRTGAAARMTRGENSHNPSLSPDGERLAVRVESDESCPDPLYGEILIGKIRVIERTTGEGVDLTEFGCDLFYDTPRWIDDETLAAVRVTKDAGEEFGYDLDVVRIDPVSGEISDLVTEGNPCCITSSPSLAKIAFPYSDRRGFGVLDVVTGEVVDFDDDAFVPHLSGEGRF